jgi:hypothetical protein
MQAAIVAENRAVQFMALQNEALKIFCNKDTGFLYVNYSRSFDK